MRLATDAIGILNALVAFDMADTDFGSFQQVAQCSPRIDLALVAAQCVNIGMERSRRTHGGIGGKRTCYQRCLCRAVSAEKTGKRQRRRGLRAVDQRQPFLGGEHDRGQPGSSESFAGGQKRTFIESLAFAHHHGGHMGKRCEIARRSDRTLFRNGRDDTLFQHVLNQPHQFQPHAGGAATERNQLQRHDQAHDIFRKRRTDAAAM
ncbi:hypothetical protein D3C87_1528790 [compost metagenome]